MTLDEIVGWMEANNVHFYHFTDGRNLPSIVQNGILSMREVRSREIESIPGGNQHSLEADVHFGMDQYVHLCFRKAHPMAYLAQQQLRISNVRWLKINAKVLTLPGVLICDQVSNKAGCIPKPPKDMINGLDWEILYGKLKWSIPENQARLRIAEKYEVLVPTLVAHEYIRNLNG